MPVYVENSSNTGDFCGWGDLGRQRIYVEVREEEILRRCEDEQSDALQLVDSASEQTWEMIYILTGREAHSQ